MHLGPTHTADISNTMKQIIQELCSDGSKVYYSNTKGVFSLKFKFEEEVLCAIPLRLLAALLAFSIEDIML